MRPDPISALFALDTIAVQLVVAANAYAYSWPQLIFLAYFVGGFMNHSLLLASHELSHDLWYFGVRVYYNGDFYKFRLFNRN